MSAVTVPGPERSGRLGYAYAVIAVVLTILVATLALVARVPPPPTIAEFAPQALQQIKQAPPSLSSNFGAGPNGQCSGGPCSGGAATTTTVPPSTTLPPGATPPGVITVPKEFQCYGDPPRQTQDPQSPPCVAYWQGNNGGATYQGVTGDTITIADPQYNAFYDGALQAYFNNHFEFYGRKIQLVPSPTNGGAGTAAQQQADAVAVQQQDHAFASMQYQGSVGYPYYQQLVREKIVAAPTDSVMSAAELAQDSPYIWQYPMANDEQFANEGQWACSRLAGKPAGHAGTGLTTKTRKFGIIYSSYLSSPLSPGPLTAALAACGSPAAEVDYLDAGTGVAEDAQTEMVKMQQKGVTSIFCLCEPLVGATSLSKAADNQGYFPEWLLSTYLYNDVSIVLKLDWSETQAIHAFGVSFTPRERPEVDDPSFWVEEETTSPSQRPYNDQEEDNRWGDERAYRSLLLLASGIQMAGPDLTPQTFGAALQATSFPDPASPLLEGNVDFGSTGHSMTVDGAEWWYSISAYGPDPAEGAGALCYVDHGARYTLGTWPKGGDPFFASGPCDSGANGP